MTAVEAARRLLEVFGSSTSLSWRLRELPKSRSIGPVGVWRLRGFQNSSSGGVGGAILEAQGAPEVTIHRPCQCLEATTPPKLEFWRGRSRHPRDIHHF